MLGNNTLAHLGAADLNHLNLVMSQTEQNFGFFIPQYRKRILFHNKFNKSDLLLDAFVQSLRQ